MIETKEKVEVKDYEITLLNGEIAKIKDSVNFKALKSSDYNFYFNKNTGFFVRWGKGNYNKIPKKISKQELDLFMTWAAIWKEKFDIKEFVADLQTDGSVDNTAVEILDWEISELCDMGCGYCYKSNLATKGTNLSFEDFKRTFHKLPKSITTIAYGIGSISLYPDLFKILKYTRENGIIPTITINGDATDGELDQLVKYCGAVAVSVHKKELSYDTIKKLTDRGLEQCNIHAVISEETYQDTLDILYDMEHDDRLKDLRALVMLSLKTKGRSFGKYHQLSQDKFEILFEKALKLGKSGFDSCSAEKVNIYLDKHPELEDVRDSVEPCEAGGVYSGYLSVGQLVNGIREPEYFPCSFTEGTDGWETGLTIKDDFMKEIWFHNRTQKFGDSVKKCRSCNIGCPIYTI